MLQCVACGGTYQALQADGLRYFHRCPPLSVAEVAARITAGTLGYPPNTTAAQFAAAAAANPVPGVTAALLAAQAWQQAAVLLRPNFRDENIAAVTPAGVEHVVSIGLGAVTVPDPAPIVVQA